MVADLPGVPASSTCTAATSRRPPTTPAWSPRCSRTTPTPRSSSAPLEVLPQLRGAFSLRLDGRGHALRRPRPAGHPAAGARPPRARLGGRQRGRRARHRRRQPSSARSSPASWSRSTRTACAPTASPRPHPKGCVFEYVYLARPDTTISGRSVHSARVEIGRRLAREFPVDADLVMPGARVRHARRDRVRRGERHPVRPGLREELLRRPHLHPAQPDDPPARHPAQAQPARAT